MPPSRVAVGSTNPAKVEAVRSVITRLLGPVPVDGVQVASGVPDQPVGAEQTLRGALGRAHRALAAVAGAEWAVGQEGGLVQEGGRTYTVTYTAAVTRDGFVNWHRGMALLLPPAVAGRVLAGEELGPVTDDVTGEANTKQAGGVIGWLSRGLFPRGLLAELEVTYALLPLIHPRLYPDLPPPRPTRDFTVATFVVHRGQVLLHWHRKLGMWLPPGGHIEPGELPDEAALREVKEETGLDAVLVSRPRLTGVPGPAPLAQPEGVQLEEIGPGHQHIDFIYFARPADPARMALTDGGWYGPEAFGRLTPEVASWARLAVESVRE